MKLQKTIKFDLYAIGDRALEGVIFYVDLEIRDDNSIICTGAVPDIDALPYLKSLGGKGAADHWEQEVLEFFEDEDTCAEELGESMTEEEFAEWEHILCFEQAGAPAEEVAKKNLFMDLDEYNDLHFGKD